MNDRSTHVPDFFERIIYQMGNGIGEYIFLDIVVCIILGMYQVWFEKMSKVFFKRHWETRDGIESLPKLPPSKKS